MIDRIKGMFKRSPRTPATTEDRRSRGAIALLIILGLFLAAMLVISYMWGGEPDSFDVVANAHQSSAHDKLVTGQVTTSALIKVANTLLDKPGGYLSNDIAPPSIMMDNIPSWEFGVLVQVRDFSKVLRNEISRAQTQSQEHPDLARAEPQFNVDSESWIFPSAEGEYQEGVKALESYLSKLSNQSDPNTQFFARADNLRDWLKVVANRLGSLSQRLSASVGQQRINTDLAGDASARQSTASQSVVDVKTPWTEIDDVFYEARGTCWALIHLLRAIEVDFAEVLEKKNALRSVQQIIRELESTQRTIWSPMILNGSDFGFFSNHSLVMSSYIARANAGIIDLRDLLSQG